MLADPSPRNDVPLRTTDALRYWLLGLTGLLVVGALAATVWVSWRGLVLLALLPVAFGPFCYARMRLHRTLSRFLGPARPQAVYALLVLGCLLDAVTIAQLLSARSDTGAGVLGGAGVFWIGPVWFSAHALLFGGYTVGSAAGIAGRVLRRVAASVRAWSALPPEEATVLLERRQFLQHFGMIGAGLPFFVSISGVRLSYDFRVEHKEIVLPHWPRALDGLKVAHLSDIHVGGAMDRPRLLEVAALTNAERPDLVLHTGDFLTHRSGDFDLPLYEALAQISAPFGQWASLGNHDFDDPSRLVARLAGAGVTTLRNRLATISIEGRPLEIAGIDFLFWRPQRESTYENIIAAWGGRTTTPRLLLNHDPRTFSELPLGAADLVLSGHTHGGHVGVQLGPSQAFTVMQLVGIPDQGIFRRGDMQMFVTRCVGFYGYPIRLGIPPEIAILTLRSPQTRSA
jgi:predicted MPP superfamily phosphohydrolase